MSNTIYLRGMEFFSYHGLMTEERKLGQRFVVDAELTLAYSGVFIKDDLTLTIDYSQVYLKIAQVMTRTSQTIEFVAEQIAQELLTGFACTSVRVEVHKPSAPIQGIFADAAVAVVRSNVWQAYLSLGSNLGDRTAYLSDALGLLRNIATIKSLSHVYETEPIGGVEQEWFYNLVVKLETPLPPFALLEKCQEFEVLCGRRRDLLSSPVNDKPTNIFPAQMTPLTRWGPRTLDIDILLMFRGLGQQQEWIENEKLLIPHPCIEEREFVLAPLRELAPDLILPSGHKVCQVAGKGKVNCLEDPCFSVGNFCG